MTVYIFFNNAMEKFVFSSVSDNQTFRQKFFRKFYCPKDFNFNVLDAPMYRGVPPSFGGPTPSQDDIIPCLNNKVS